MRHTPVSIPIGWNRIKLGLLGDTFGGLAGKSKEDFGHGKPYVPYMNVYSNAQVDIAALEQVEVAEDESQNNLQYGDVIFTTSSETPDEVGISSILLDRPKEKLYLNSFCFALRLRSFDDLLPEYAKYLFRAQPFRKRMFRLAQGASRYNLSKSHFADEEVLLPPLDEQKRIVRILETWDTEIGELTKQLEKTTKLNCALRRVSLMPSSGWVSHAFGDCLNVLPKPAGVKQAEYLVSGEYPVVDQSVELVAGYSDDRDLMFSSPLPVIVFGDHTRAIKFVDFPFVPSNDGTKLFTARPGFSTEFLYHLLASKPIPNTGYNRHFKYVSEFVFDTPNLQEQTRIAEQLRKGAEVALLLNKKLEATRSQQQYLLNNLVTGTVRTPEKMGV